MSPPRLSIHGGPLYEIARARQQEMLDEAMRHRLYAASVAARTDVASQKTVDYGPWLRLVSVAKSAG